MNIAAGERIGWADLPGQVRAGVEDILGGPVVDAAGQRGGFSPGTADRVITAEGRRAFVKAVGSALNNDSPGIHRQETAVTDSLPAGMPAARLIGSYDDGDWVALVLTDVDGVSPRLPWEENELTRVLDSLHEIAQLRIPGALLHLPTAAEALAEPLRGWQRLRDDPSDDLDGWAAANLDELDRLAGLAAESLQGHSLIHMDVRADNILFTRDEGRAILVDWPWACIGAGWFDALTLLINVRAYDPAFDVDRVLERHPAFGTGSAEDFNNVLSGLGAYLFDAARRPSPKGLPTVRAFQRLQGEAVLNWLRQRLER